MLGIVSGAGFWLAYSWRSMRVGWWVSVSTGWSGIFALAGMLERFSGPLVLSFVGVISCLILALYLLPGSQSPTVMTNPPQWETLLRMFVATAFVVGLTAIAAFLGPQLSGLLTPFPVFASILGVFTHHFQDAAAARRLLRGVLTGSFAFDVFFLFVAGSIEASGIALAFILATLAALVMHGGSLLLLRKLRTRKA